MESPEFSGRGIRIIFYLDPRVKPEDDRGKRGEGGQFPFFTSPLRGEVAERSDAGEGEKGKADICSPRPSHL